MKKLSTLLLSAVFATIIFSACEKVNGNGPMITESRSLSNNVKHINLEISADVFYTQDSVSSIIIEGQENIVKHIRTNVNSDELVIDKENKVILNTTQPLRVYVRAPSVESFTVSGSGTIKVMDTLITNYAGVRVSGSGNVRMDRLFNTGTTDFTISGSGTIEVMGGYSTKENCNISGSGSIKGEFFEVNDVSTHTSGSGDTRIHAKDNLEVIITGSGSVYYRGLPKVNKVEISGSGKLERI